ncbi:MAG: hypothetical protein ACI9XC_002665, partial [Gammaproteobacteria bacterium]
MRWLFIFLLLVNVVYLGWEVDRGTKIEIMKTPVAINIPSNASMLQLISELQIPPVTRVVYINEQVNVLELSENEELVAELPDILLNQTDEIISSEMCFRYGPIPDESIIRGLSDWFRSRNVIERIHYNEEQSSQMFWVYLAPQQTKENALAVIQEMENKGIGDFRLINRGDLENAISLGLYSSQEAVNNRLKELNNKGYVPVVVPYSDVSRLYWLDIKMTNSSIAKNELFNG